LFDGAKACDDRRMIEVPNHFITLKADNDLRDNEHFDGASLVRLTSPWYKSPDEAREIVVRSAKDCEANLILGAKMTKETFSEGNYKYSMHRFTGLAGVYFKYGKNASTNEVSLSRQSLLSRIETTANDLEDQSQFLARLSKPPFKNFNPLYLIILAIMLLTFAFGAMRH
jgi:hypothetical protein